MDHHLPVSLVCGVLGAPRSSVDARRGRSGMPPRPGPATAISDQELVELIRQVLEDSPFAGEGYRKVRARLRREHGVHVSGKRCCGCSGGKAAGTAARPGPAQTTPA
jgi:putative transposase